MSSISTGSSSSKNIAETKKSGNRLSVLIVDDDPVIQRIHSVFMKRFGLESRAVGNGKEAVDLFRSGASFHLVLMDKEMPVMDGPTATRELRGMGVDSMIVGVSSCDGDSEKHAFMAAGLDDFYVKPLTADKVTSFLEQLNKMY